MRYFIPAICMCLLVLPAVALTEENVIYTVNDSEYEGYFLSAGEDAPLILMIHDWDGLTDYEMKRARMLRELGYSVFAADLFGKGLRPDTLEEKQKATGELYSDRGKMRALMNGALKAAEERGGNVSKAVAMGYCFGGTAVLELARSGAEFMAFVPFHGGLETPEGQDYSQVKGEILVFHGSADSHVSLEDFAALAKALEASGTAHEMITYGGARHAFSVFDSDRYDAKADKRSWSRFTDFLEMLFKPHREMNTKA